MSIGAQIKKYRNQRGLTQVNLAAKAGISRSYLADVEADRYNPSLAMLMDLAQALGVAVSCLIDEEQEIDFRNLERACREENVSLESLCASLNIPDAALERIRANKLPDEDTIFKLCDYFNCTWDYIIGKTNSPEEMVFGNKAVSISDITANITAKTAKPIKPNRIPATIAAHFEKTDFTEEEIEEINDYISFLTERRKKRQP